MRKTALPQVVTWASPDGGQIDICPACEQIMRADGVWPHDGHGQEFCQVAHGLHNDLCHICERGRVEANVW